MTSVDRLRFAPFVRVRLSESWESSVAKRRACKVMVEGERRGRRRCDAMTGRGRVRSWDVRRGVEMQSTRWPV